MQTLDQELARIEKERTQARRAIVVAQYAPLLEEMAIPARKIAAAANLSLLPFSDQHQVYHDSESIWNGDGGYIASLDKTCFSVETSAGKEWSSRDTQTFPSAQAALVYSIDLRHAYQNIWPEELRHTSQLLTDLKKTCEETARAHVAKTEDLTLIARLHDSLQEIRLIADKLPGIEKTVHEEYTGWLIDAYTPLVESALTYAKNIMLVVKKYALPITLPIETVGEQLSIRTDGTMRTKNDADRTMQSLFHRHYEHDEKTRSRSDPIIPMSVYAERTLPPIPGIIRKAAAELV